MTQWTRHWLYDWGGANQDLLLAIQRALPDGRIWLPEVMSALGSYWGAPAVVILLLVWPRMGVNTDGQREVLGLKVGASAAEPFWTEFLRSLNRRGLRGAKLVISDSHEGIKAAAAKVLKATWQRCRVHFMRNALAHAGKTQRRMVSAAIGTVFVQDSAEAARTQWRSVAAQLRGKFPKLGALMDEAENDVLAFMTFPRAHWTQIYSTNPLERLNAEIKRRTNVVGIFPNDASIVRLVGAMMLEQHDEWSLNRRYMQLEGLQTASDTVPTRLSAVARRVTRISALSGLWTYTTRWDTTEVQGAIGPFSPVGLLRQNRP